MLHSFRGHAGAAGSRTCLILTAAVCFALAAPTIPSLAQTVSDSDFVMLDSLCAVPADTDTTVAMTMSIDVQAEVMAFVFPLSYGGHANLTIDQSVDSAGITFYGLGSHSCWEQLTVYHDTAAKTVLVGLVAFGNPLPAPATGALFAINFRVAATAEPVLITVDSLSLPPENFLSFTDVHYDEYIPQFRPGVLGVDVDSDGDGLVDICDVCPYDPLNDVDGDLVCGDVDNCPQTYNPGQDNGDSDSQGDACDNCPLVDNEDQSDADGDGEGDVCDDCTDTDGDGFGNPGFPANTCPEDLCPYVYDPLQNDGDSDGFGDSCDVCPELFNPGQEDADSDMVGDICDNCVFSFNPEQEDDDGDQIGDSCDVNEPMYIASRGVVEQAWGESPVYLIVVDPVGDSISPDFNTILMGSSYDAQADIDNDGQYDDLVTILNPWRGEYYIRLVRKEGVPDDIMFSTSVRINGNQMMDVDGYTSQPVSALGTVISDSVGYTMCLVLTGDVNADGVTTSADIIYLVNYVFKGGPPPVNPGTGDVNCDGTVTSADIIYLVCYVFKGGPPPCSQSCD